MRDGLHWDGIDGGVCISWFGLSLSRLSFILLLRSFSCIVTLSTEVMTGLPPRPNEPGSFQHQHPEVLSISQPWTIHTCSRWLWTISMYEWLDEGARPLAFLADLLLLSTHAPCSVVLPFLMCFQLCCLSLVLTLYTAHCTWSAWHYLTLVLLLMIIVHIRPNFITQLYHALSLYCFTYCLYTVCVVTFICENTCKCKHTICILCCYLHGKTDSSQALCTIHF